MPTTTIDQPQQKYVFGPSSDDEEAWLEARRHVLSATQLAEIASGTTTAFRSLYKKRRSTDRFLGNRYTEHGNSRELFIAGYALGKYGLYHNRDLMISTEWEWLAATPDLVSPDGDKVVDAKTKHAGSGRILKPPRRYADQVVVQALVTGARQMGLLVEHWLGEEGEPALIVDDEPIYMEILWDEERADHLLTVGERYMEFEEEEDIVNEFL